MTRDPATHEVLHALRSRYARTRAWAAPSALARETGLSVPEVACAPRVLAVQGHAERMIDWGADGIAEGWRIIKRDHANVAAAE